MGQSTQHMAACTHQQYHSVRHIVRRQPAHDQHNTSLHAGRLPACMQAGCRGGLCSLSASGGCGAACCLLWQPCSRRALPAQLGSAHVTGHTRMLCSQAHPSNPMAPWPPTRALVGGHATVGHGHINTQTHRRESPHRRSNCNTSVHSLSQKMDMIHTPHTYHTHQRFVCISTRLVQHAQRESGGGKHSAPAHLCGVGSVAHLCSSTACTVLRTKVQCT